MRGFLAIGVVIFVVAFFLMRHSAQSQSRPPTLERQTVDRVDIKKERRNQMKEQANVTFKIKSWDEKPYNEIEGAPKLTRTKVSKTYHGDIEGESKLEYLMMYCQNGTASFVGIERVVGSLNGRSGSFVLQHIGTFQEGIAKVNLLVVPGSSTDELIGLRGAGSFAVGHTEPYAMTLDFYFE